MKPIRKTLAIIHSWILMYIILRTSKISIFGQGLHDMKCMSLYEEIVCIHGASLVINKIFPSARSIFVPHAMLIWASLLVHIARDCPITCEINWWLIMLTAWISGLWTPSTVVGVWCPANGSFPSVWESQLSQSLRKNGLRKGCNVPILSTLFLTYTFSKSIT